MTGQLIKVGDVVRLQYGFADRSGTGDYEVVRVMPVRESGEPQYRIRGADGHERAIGHHQIVVSNARSLASGSL